MGAEGGLRSGRIMRRAVCLLLVPALLLAVLAAIGYRNALADPVVRRMTVRLPQWPAGAAPVRVLLWSDLHLGDRVTDRARLVRLVAQAAALRPDLVVLAGDYIAGHGRADAAAAPGLSVLAALRPPLGVVAVLGNHDHWTDAPRVRAALARAGVVVLANAAVRRGPVTVGGIDDMVSRRADAAATVVAMARRGGAPVLVSHSPDIAPHLPAAMPLLLAGHTHCGQIVLPWIGPIAQVVAPRYRCGPVRANTNGREGRLTIVTAGTGTSVVPLRWGAPPDWWLLTLEP